VGAVGLILLRRCVPEADLFLIVEPCLIVRAEAGIEHPLHEPFLHARFVRIIRFSILGTSCKSAAACTRGSGLLLTRQDGLSMPHASTAASRKAGLDFRQ
jgi:hypothetical protein